jgi:hypothetical protein
MSSPGSLQINVIKHMKDEDWTARLFTEYLNAASTVLGDHKSLKSRDFMDIEA